MNNVRRAWAMLAAVVSNPFWCAAAQGAGANINRPGSRAMQPAERTRTATRNHPLASNADLPASADLRPKFAGFGLTPRVQGGRGTCSVFAVTQAREFAVARRKGVGERLSEEFLNWASNQAVGETADGGFFSDLWKGFEKYGVCAEPAMPYREKFEPDASPSADATAQAAAAQKLGLQLHWIKEWDVNTGLTAEHLASIKRTIAGGWPVFTGLRWPKHAEWDNNVLRMAAPADVFDGHSILFVGYRDDPAMPGGGAFIFRNSSGPARESEMTYEYALAYANDAAWIDAPLIDAGVSASAGSQEQDAERGQAIRPGVRPRAEDATITELLSPSALAPAGRNRRVSSNMQPAWNTENLDMTWLQPGESIEMPRLEGPGVITHMWFTSHAGWTGELNSLSLRIYWDGSTTPGVEAPLADFFAVGQGKPAVVESEVVQVSATGSLSCYWRMPFEKSARIVVTNDNPERGAGLYWQVDWTQLPSLPAGTPRFYAKYRQEYPAQSGRDYVLAELTGKGRYVGTVMSLTLAQDGWFGEGDDFFFIDGEQTPSLQGTGSEDYFNDAWGFRPRTSRWFGSPRWQGDSTGDSGVCYRWHVADAVNFDRSLKAAIEHKGNLPEDTAGFFVERPDFISSVAFWYQEGEPAPWAPLPGWSDRRVPWDRHHFVRDYQAARQSLGDTVKIDTSGLFGARPVLLWTNRAPDASVSFPFEVKSDAEYAVRLTAASGGDHGKYHVEIDGRRADTLDFRTPDGAELDLSLGRLTLTKGPHTIAFKATKDQPGPLAIEMLRLLKLPPAAKREPKTHHEAHFVRLAIGRAAYAFRLAFGRVPESLDDLVKSGTLDARYLNDENNVPLKSRREGEHLVVESTAGEVWTHKWTGLDARR
ncbi:MAG: DUF2961 domain-containing protein [Phycisphaerales bacterium]|nr:DUF2961 domain-containing protein [Phycisphaerales bacterium]